MIDIRDTPDGPILEVRAKPGAKLDALIDEFDGALRVSVVAAPEGGKANEAIVRVLAGSLNVRKSQITLISGETSRQKRFLFTGLTSAELRSRISAAIDPTVFEPPSSPNEPPST